jgi:hypothetical protein
MIKFNFIKRARAAGGIPNLETPGCSSSIPEPPDSRFTPHASRFKYFGIVKVWMAIVSIYAAPLAGLIIWIKYRPQIKAALLAAQNLIFG